MAHADTVPTRNNERRFWRALIDFGFDRFATTRVAQFLYGVAFVFAGIAFLVTVIFGLVMISNQSAGVGLVLLFVSPIYPVLSIVVTRVVLEFFVVQARMLEELKRTRSDI